LEPLIDPTSDEENSMNNIISTSTISTLVTKLHYKHPGTKKNHDKKLLSSIAKSSFIPKSNDHDANNNDNLKKKPSLSQDSSILLPTKSICKKK
jgi:hypothetical protein